MKSKRYVLLLSIVVVSLSLHLPAQKWSGVLSPTRAYDWSNAGVSGGIQNRTTICATLSPGATVAQINSAISSCPAGQVVFLSAGTYNNLSTAITFGSKNNVTLRGAGADKTILNFTGGDGCGGPASSICIEGAWANTEGTPQRVANWTGGYAQGSTVITLSSTTGLAVGHMIILDQLNDSSDTGEVFVCSTTSCSDEGGNSPGRSNRGQQQFVLVKAISGNNVTIDPPLMMPNWRASQNPQVFWSGSAPRSGDGVEDFTVSVAGGQNGIVIIGAANNWVKGVRVLHPDRNHVWLYQSMRSTVRDSYFYGGQSDHSTSYGVEDFGTGSNLIENNILQHITAPLSHNGTNSGSVIAYNYNIDNNYTAGGDSPGWMIGTVMFHEVGISHLLHEGHDGLGVLHDDIHGTTQFNTIFRNHFYGDVWNNPPKTSNTSIIHLQSYGRYFNIVGNVLGRTGYYTTYEPSGSTGDGDKNIYSFGDSPESAVPNDPLVKSTLLRWGNYDTVTGAVRWNAGEVPSGISKFANPVPSTQNLPASLYLSGKPAWFGDVAWPPIGPDVAGGTVSGYVGHANKIPARLCYEETAKTNNILNFNAATCYGSGTTTPPGTPAPPTGLNVIVK
jgi:hypothetical protein